MTDFNIAYTKFKIRIEKEYCQLDKTKNSIIITYYKYQNIDNENIIINLDFLKDLKIKKDSYKNYIKYQTDLILYNFFTHNGYNPRFTSSTNLDTIAKITELNQELLLSKKYSILKSVHLIGLDEIYIRKENYKVEQLEYNPHYIYATLYCPETNTVFLISIYQLLVIFNIKEKFFKNNPKLVAEINKIK